MEDGISLGGPDTHSANPSDGDKGVAVGSDTSVSEPATSSGNTWHAALNEDNRRLVENKGWKSPDEALKSYSELDEYRGRSVALPGDDATDEDWRAFRHKLGTPKAAEAYEFEGNEGADEAALQSLKGIFLEVGLDQRQAGALYGRLSESYAQSAQAQQAAVAEARQNAMGEAKMALIDAWGNEDGSAFKRNMEAARRAVTELGGDELIGELRQIGALTHDNEILSPVLAKLMAEVGTQLFAEDALTRGGDALTVNPFAKDSMNLKAQGQLVNSDPQTARAMIRAAGKRPEDYGLSTN